MTNEEINSGVEREGTEIIYGYDNIIKLAINNFSKIGKKLDICTYASGLNFFSNPLLLSKLTILNKKGIKLRFITEITKDNLEYSKKFANLMDFRHLDGIKVNFGISDGKRYACTSNTTEEQIPNELVYSTVSTFVKQQQFFMKFYGKINSCRAKNKRY